MSSLKTSCRTVASSIISEFHRHTSVSVCCLHAQPSINPPYLVKASHSFGTTQHSVPPSPVSTLCKPSTLGDLAEGHIQISAGMADADLDPGLDLGKRDGDDMEGLEEYELERQANIK